MPEYGGRRQAVLLSTPINGGVRQSTSVDGGLRCGRRSMPVYGGRKQAVRWSTPIKGAVRLSMPESFNTIGRQWQMTRPCNHANVPNSPAGGTDGEIRLAWSVWQVDYAGKLSLIAKTGDCALSTGTLAAARQPPPVKGGGAYSSKEETESSQGPNRPKDRTVSQSTEMVDARPVNVY